MPVYVYRNPKTKKYIEVIQKMTDVHEFWENGVKCERVFIVPHTAVDTRVDPFSKADFLRRTNKHMKIGDMMDESAELSEKRASIAGEDPIRKKVFDDYQKKTGKRHPFNKPKKVETKDFVLEF